MSDEAKAFGLAIGAILDGFEAGRIDGREARERIDVACRERAGKTADEAKEAA